jgi:hypothetical protein
MKKYTIEDLAQGRCAVINDGCVEELREVLRRAFPDDYSEIKNYDICRFYSKSKVNEDTWIYDDDLGYWGSIGSQSVKDFLVEEELFQYEYKWYDVREVLPDERFDGKEVIVTVELLTLGVLEKRIYWWDNKQEAFTWVDPNDPPINVDEDQLLSDGVLYWCPLPTLPQ